MSSADYLAGSVALSVIGLPWVVASRRASHRLWPEADGPLGALVAAIVALSGILVVAELLGMAGWFARWPMAAASAAVATAVAVLAGRGTPIAVPAQPKRAATGTQRAALVLAGLCLLGVSAAFLGRDARVLHTGPSDTDTVHYHFTQPARFVQTHDINHLDVTGSSDFSSYFPFDDELLDAVAMLGPKPDLATLPLNLGFGWLALLACWVIGARWGMGPSALAGGSAVFAIPLFAGASSGPGLNDIPALAALLAAIAIAVHAERQPPRWIASTAVAGLALGLAGGGKLSLLPMVLAVAVTLLVIAPVRRGLTAAVIVAGALITGGFWYVRDWVAVGSPLPNTNLMIAGHGLRGVPYPQLRPYAFSVAHYLTNGPVIRHYFVPALKVTMTPLWPVVLVLVAAGIVAAMVGPGSRPRRTLALSAVFGLAVYVVTPTTALGLPNRPLLFGSNLRYVMPVVAVSMVLLATAPPLRRYATAVTAGFTVLTFALLSSSTTARYVDRAAGWAAALVIAAAIAWLRVALPRPPSPRLVAALAVTALLAAVGVGAVVQRRYLRERYSAADPLDQLLAWGATVHDQRIGVAGGQLQYPFFGPTLDNYVGYVGVSAPDGSFAAPTSCGGWRAALKTGRYSYVVIQPLPVEHTTALLAWTTALPGAHVVIANAAGTIVSLPHTIDPAACSTV